MNIDSFCQKSHYLLPKDLFIYLFFTLRNEKSKERTKKCI